MALTIATGFVVDDAIVVVENISRYLEEGDTPLQAALKGSEQIGFTIISLTVSLIAVLIPLLFMGDVVGRLFREFAITLSVTILISAVVSLTLVPMACAKLLKPESQNAGKCLPAPQPRSVRLDHRDVRPRAHLGAGPSTDYPGGRARHFRSDGATLCHDPEGVLSASGYRRDPGDFGSAAIGVLCSDGRTPAAARFASS